MKINVILKADKKDSFNPMVSKGEHSIFLESIFSDKKCEHVAHDIKTIIEKLEQFPEGSVVDFANLSLAVYTIDQLVSRKENGYQDWSRYFKIWLPVESLAKWNACKERIESMLSFLTGDKWELDFRTKKANAKIIKLALNKGSIARVSLFSGGLDSLIGAVNLIEVNNEIALVSHHKIGTSEYTAQESLVNVLQKEYSQKTIKPNFFYVQPKQENNKFGRENTQRARSIMFIALGLLVANCYGKDTVLEIPENALISLNIPLTMTRYGSYSTKTTHPNFLGMLGEILSGISITNSLDNPYKFKTKGEMLVECSNISLIKRIADSSISCSKPFYYRRWTKKTGAQKSLVAHCGHCVPCIIRRASFHRAKVDKFKGNYVIDVLEKSTEEYSDVRAFKIGLTRFKSKSKINIFDLLRGGIFPVKNSIEISNYIGAYKRGMDEVNNFIRQKK